MFSCMQFSGKIGQVHAKGWRQPLGNRTCKLICKRQGPGDTLTTTRPHDIDRRYPTGRTDRQTDNSEKRTSPRMYTYVVRKNAKRERALIEGPFIRYVCDNIFCVNEQRCGCIRDSAICTSYYRPLPSPPTAGPTAVPPSPAPWLQA